MHTVWTVSVVILILGFIRLSYRRGIILIAVTALAAGFGLSGLFRIRPARLLGELLMLGAMLFAAHELAFFEGRFAPEQAVHSKLKIHLPFLHWFVTTFGVVLIVLVLLVFLGVLGFIAWSRYTAARELRIGPLPAVTKPVFVRMALFNSSVVFLKRRSALTWLRSELSCFTVALIAAAGSESSEELADDRHFRRLLGPTAWDWATFVDFATGLRNSTERLEDLDFAIDEGIDLLGTHAHSVIGSLPALEEGAP